jgi:S1-C subfamily serine protease
MPQQNIKFRACPFCGKDAPVKALLCPACEKNISVGILVTNRITDSAARHAVAKKLLTLQSGSIFSNYSKINTLLKDGNSVIVKEVCYQDALEISEIVKAAGAECKIEPIQFLQPSAVPPEAALETHKGSNILKSALSLLSILAFFTLGYYYFKTVNRSDESASRIEQVPTKSEVQERQHITEPIYQESGAYNAITPSADVKRNINKLVSATVMITGERSIGSGFIIKSDGYIITNNHVIAGQSMLYVSLESSARFQARVLKTDLRLDLALLKIEAQDLPVLSMGDATRLQRGDDVWTIGAPKELAFSVTKGIVSYAGRNINGNYYLQSDVAINPGNSGGPMINDRGEVVGINSFMLSRSQEGLNFSLPINYVYSGPNPIAEGLLPLPSYSRMEEVWAKAGENERKAYFSNPNEKSLPSFDSDPTAISKYTEKMKELSSEYENKKRGLEFEKANLTSKKSELESKYNNYDKMNISEEVKAGKELRDTEIAIFNKEIDLLELNKRYNDNMLSVLKEASDNIKEEPDASKIKASIDSYLASNEEINAGIKNFNTQIESTKQKKY